jgi:pimeloyl-ACP methyl ester carboxylesterase
VNGLAFDADDADWSLSADDRRPVVLIHAGVCDRRMWDDLLPALSGHRVVRMDLRGFGGSASRPDAPFSHHGDVATLLDELGIRAAHLVGVSMGAGVAAEIALARPDLVRSLLLVAPGGALRAGSPSPELEAFWAAEETALESGDIDGAVEANLRTWVDGPGRPPSAVDPKLRARVGAMQKRAFELTAGWDVEERLLEPRVAGRLADIAAPTLVLVGDGDLADIRDTARRIVGDVAGARLVEWPAVAHLPPMERPAEFARLALDWFADADAVSLRSAGQYR